MMLSCCLIWPPVWCGVGAMCALWRAGCAARVWFVCAVLCWGGALWAAGCAAAGSGLGGGLGAALGAAGIGGHLQDDFTVVAEVDRGELRILLLPLRDVRLVVAPAGEEVFLSEMQEQVGAVGRDGGADVIGIGEVDFAQLRGDVFAGRVQVGDESLIEVHARAANGERVSGDDATDNREGVVARGHLLRGHGEEHAIGVGQLDAAVDLDEGDRGAFGHSDAQLIGQAGA